MSGQRVIQRAVGVYDVEISGGFCARGTVTVAYVAGFADRRCRLGGRLLQGRPARFTWGGCSTSLLIGSSTENRTKMLKEAVLELQKWLKSPIVVEVPV